MTMPPESFQRLLAQAVDILHVLVMVLWVGGLPLLVWHRFPGLSRAYMWFATAFVLVSVISHQLLGECFLTSLARGRWQAGGGYRDAVPFTVVLADAVAGLRPSERSVVIAWEFFVLLSSAGSLWCWHRTKGAAWLVPGHAQRRNPR
jgi:hypothetical protein